MEGEHFWAQARILGSALGRAILALGSSVPQKAGRLTFMGHAQASICPAEDSMAQGPGCLLGAEYEGNSALQHPWLPGDEWTQQRASCPTACRRKRLSSPPPPLGPPRGGVWVQPPPRPCHWGPSDTLSFALQLGAGNQERESIIAENPF